MNKYSLSTILIRMDYLILNRERERLKIGWNEGEYHTACMMRNSINSMLSALFAFGVISADEQYALQNLLKIEE